MIRLAAFLVIAFSAIPLQAQQAGDAASTDTEGTFQSLVDACDDVDALMLRARIRLQIPRSTEEAASKAEEMLKQGFTTCSTGDLEGAKAQLSEALAIAEAGAAENFSVEESSSTSVADAASEAAAQSSQPVPEQTAENDKPWWKFW